LDLLLIGVIEPANGQAARALLQGTFCSTAQEIPKYAPRSCFIRSLPGVTGQVPVCTTCMSGYVRINKGRTCGECQQMLELCGMDMCTCAAVTVVLCLPGTQLLWDMACTQLECVFICSWDAEFSLSDVQQ
jgi:hypothetical protein